MNKKSLSSNELKSMVDAMDLIMEKYQENNKIIFKNEADRAKNHFGLLSKDMREWKKTNDCIVPNCIEKSINKSHTIPRAMLLDSIAENGHVLSPEFNQVKGKLMMKSVGISLASTFPGFCSNHESLFEGFEVTKNIETEEHIYLQIYRAACRELFRSSLLVKQNESMISSYCELRDERLKTLIKEEALKNGFPKDADFKSVSITKDPLIERSNKHISGVKALSSHIKNTLLPALENAVFNHNDSDIFTYAINIDLEFPVALSGCAPFFVNDNGQDKKIYLIINIVPQKNKTLFVFAGDIKDKENINHYIKKWSVNIFTLLSMVETWMINGSDQWYIKPSVWNRLPDERKKILLSDIIECKQNIGGEYKLSILDDMRKNMLAVLAGKEEPTTRKDYIDLVKSQKNKMI